MKLYGSPNSPYTRKVRVLIHEKELPVEFVHEDPWPEDTLIPTRNPLGKVPVLEVMPERYLFESMLICHYLDHVKGESLVPQDSSGYWKTQWWQALAQGILDAAVTRVVETRRPQDKQMPEKRAREEARIHRAVATAEQMFEGGRFLVGGRFTLADLSLGVALQYVDFRYPHDWRSSCPDIAKWHAAIVRRSSFQETLPPGFTPVE